jgi:hypothetical protein
MQRLRDCHKLKTETYSAHLIRFHRLLAEIDVNSLSQPSVLDAYLHTLDHDVMFEVGRSYRDRLDAPTWSKDLSPSLCWS